MLGWGKKESAYYFSIAHSFFLLLLLNIPPFFYIYTLAIFIHTYIYVTVTVYACAFCVRSHYLLNF